MQKLNDYNLELINGGQLTCGWVGVFVVVSLGSGLGMILGAVTGLYTRAYECWNS